MISIEAKRAQGREATKRELERPSYPPKLPLNWYPKRCPCGALVTSEQSHPGTLVEIIVMRCAHGHEWKEARCEPF